LGPGVNDISIVHTLTFGYGVPHVIGFRYGYAGLIRSLPANAMDSEFCLILGQQAVHAEMARYTDTAVGYWNRHFTHVPMSLAVAHRKQRDPQGPEWQGALQTIGQPASMLGVSYRHPN